MTKPPSNTGPIAPQPRFRDLARQGARQAIKSIPVVGDLLEVVGNAAVDSREARKAEWAAYVLGDADGSEVAQAVEAALGSADGDVVRSALLDGARAAVDAVDDAVIPSIGLLTRRRVQKKDPDLLRYRDLLTLLRMLNGDEFGALRDAITAIMTALTTRARIDHSGDVQTFLSWDKKHADDPGRWLWAAGIPYEAGYSVTSDTALRLLEGPPAVRMVRLLLGNDRALFERPPELDTKGPLFTRSMIELLHSIMPPGEITPPA